MNIGSYRVMRLCRPIHCTLRWMMQKAATGHRPQQVGACPQPRRGDRMSTSGDTTFNLQSSEIVAKAFSILGVRSEGENLSARQLEDGRTVSNLLVKTWGARPSSLDPARNAL